MPHQALVTADELERWPDAEFRHELVKGQVITMSLPASVHGLVTSNVILLLGGYVKQHALGVVMSEMGFKLASNPDTVRGPDAAFLRAERIAGGLPRGFWNGAPDLAIEVLSPDDRPSAMRDKIAEYLAVGVALVWVVDPARRRVTAHRRLSLPVTLHEHDTLTASDVVPGFSCTVRELFD